MIYQNPSFSDMDMFSPRESKHDEADSFRDDYLSDDYLDKLEQLVRKHWNDVWQIVQDRQQRSL
jgi:hypothetical protein